MLSPKSTVVGYTTTPTKIGDMKFSLGTAPFESVGEDGLVKVADMVKSSALAAGYDYREEQAAALQVWDGAGYAFYWYINDAGDNMDETGWADGSGYVTEAKVAPGTGYWYKAPGETTFTLAGQVSPLATITKDIPKNSFQLVGNPFPTALYLTKLTTTIPAAGYDYREEQAAALQVWDGAGYAFYWYINDAGDNMDETGWADGSGYVKEDVAADATKGFWIVSPAAAGTITFEK